MKLIQLLCLAAVFACGVGLGAQTWDETADGGGDSGELPATGQNVIGSGSLTSITGDLSSLVDRDFFRVQIANPAAFSATTVGSTGTNDTVIMLFDDNGVGIALNDDDSSSVYLSTLPSGNPLYNALPAGIYWIAVSRYRSFPDSSSGPIWNDSMTLEGVHAPLNTNPVTGWTQYWTYGLDGAYTITLTGCEFITPPAAPDMSVERNSAVVANAGNDSLTDVSTTGEIFTYEIHNNGTDNLTLTGNPIIDITPGVGAPTVNIVTAPALSVIPFPGMTSFQIEVIPAVGAFDFTISIDNDDPAKNPYVITVDGNGIITNMPAKAEIATGSVFLGGTNGPFDMDADPAETLSNAAIELTDPDLDDIIITNITPPATALAGITPPDIGTAGHPRVLEWTGTVDPSNAPGPYTWQIDFEDVGTNTPVSIMVTITVNDLEPEHVIADADGGDGTSVASPYTTEFTQGDDTTATVDLAAVTDPNTSQALSIDTVAPGGSNPQLGSFSFAFVSGMLVIAPSGTLDAGDMGTHTFEVVVIDGTNPVTIHVSVLVYGTTGAITFTTTSPLPNGRVDQAYDQTIDIAGATGTATFSIMTGALPAGLTMNASGQISGTPTVAGQSTFTVHVVDSGPDTATMAFQLTISPKPVGSSSSSGSDGCSTSEGSSTTLLMVLAAIAGAGAILRLRRRAA